MWANVLLLNRNSEFSLDSSLMLAFVTETAIRILVVKSPQINSNRVHSIIFRQLFRATFPSPHIIFPLSDTRLCEFKNTQLYSHIGGYIKNKRRVTTAGEMIMQFVAEKLDLMHISTQEKKLQFWKIENEDGRDNDTSRPSLLTYCWLTTTGGNLLNRWEMMMTLRRLNPHLMVVKFFETVA